MLKIDINYKSWATILAILLNADKNLFSYIYVKKDVTSGENKEHEFFSFNEFQKALEKEYSR